TELRHARHIAALWTGVLLAPTAFLANLELAYLAVRVACLRDNTLPVHLVHATFLLVALGGVFVAWRAWQAEGSEWPGDKGGLGAWAVWRRAGTGRGVRPGEAGAFALGWVVLVTALVSPLHRLGEVLLSAHMAQHVLLMAVAAPLLVAGRPVVTLVWGLPPAW